MKKTPEAQILKKLMVLGQKQGAIKLKDLAAEMNLDDEETLGFLRQVFPVGIGIEVYHQDNECWVDVRGDAVQYMLPLSPGEWIQLHQILLDYQGPETGITYALKKKITENGPIKVVMDLLNQLDHWDHELTEMQQGFIALIDKAIEEKQLIGILSSEAKKYSIHPCKILHLEGHLSLIAEDSQDHCLVVLPMKEVTTFEVIQTNSQAKVSPWEIEEFITAIRAMNERETRLILKIHDPQSTNLFPDHHFLGKPCMITNPNGDLIWAAYVEPCEALFDWLMTLGKNAEILDPIKFKEEYLMYCEEKMRKIA
jgi:predicted DNA-binding transcriptional regulator YafY